MITFNRFFFVLFQLAAIAFALGAFEVLLRTEVIRPKFHLADFSYRIDQRLLYDFVPNGSPQIDSHGRRVSSLSGGRQEKKVWYFGDSFVFGTGVSPEESTPHHLQELVADQYQVLNFGVPGYGPDQSLLKLRDVQHEISPGDVVILGVYAGNDMTDIGRNKLFTLDEEGELRSTPGEYAKWTKTSFLTPFVLDMYLMPFTKDKTFFSQFYRNLFTNLFDEEFARAPFSEAALAKKDLMGRLLSEFVSLAKAQKARVFTVLIPSYESYHLEDQLRSKGIKPTIMRETFLEICEAQVLDCVDIDKFWSERNLEPRELYSADDWHFKSKGYKSVADSVAKRVLSDEPALNE